MFTEKFFPRFTDTDALGHINNTRLPVWFEGCREPMFTLFTPDLDIKKWRLIIAKIEVNYHAQMYYGSEMKVNTYIKHIGNSSFTAYQELWQKNVKCASGETVLVHFCFEQQKSIPLPEDIKLKMQPHMLNGKDV